MSETPSGAEEMRVARGTMAQQGAQVVGVAAMLVAVTLVGRSLPLASFGLYGLVISIASYLLIVQYSVEGATVRVLSGATTVAERDRWATTAIALYAVAGVVSGLVIVGLGYLGTGILSISPGLHDEARAGAIALGVVTAVGWPLKVFQDVLRGTHRFGHASAAEVLAHVCFVTGTAVLVVAGAPLWALIALGGSLPVITGGASAVVLAATRTFPRLRVGGVHRKDVRDLVGFAGGLSAIGASDLIVYSLDRFVLAGFTSTSTVGLYEAAVRPHNLVRQLNATLTIAVMPVAARYVHAGDDPRLRELLIRGTRYVAAAVIPATVVLMALGGPILDVWLGDEFRQAGDAMAILLSYWLVSAGTGVAGSMLVAAGELKGMFRYAWAVALVNLTLSLILTPLIGLDGVVLGTAIPQIVMIPYFVGLIRRTFDVGWRELVREAFMPAWKVGALLAVALGAVRLAFDLDTLVPVLLVTGTAMFAGYGLYAVLFLRDYERALIRNLLKRAEPAQPPASSSA
jgi:O-antigen/teichoic acid export membrane protein